MALSRASWAAFSVASAAWVMANETAPDNSASAEETSTDAAVLVVATDASSETMALGGTGRIAIS